MWYLTRSLKYKSGADSYQDLIRDVSPYPAIMPIVARVSDLGEKPGSSPLSEDNGASRLRSGAEM